MTKPHNAFEANVAILREIVRFAYDQGFHELGYDIVNEWLAQVRPPAEPAAPTFDINSIERIARQQAVFGGRDGNTVTITGPIVISGPSSRTNR